MGEHSASRIHDVATRSDEAPDALTLALAPSASLANVPDRAIERPCANMARRARVRRGKVVGIEHLNPSPNPRSPTHRGAGAPGLGCQRSWPVHRAPRGLWAPWMGTYQGPDTRRSNARGRRRRVSSRCSTAGASASYLGQKCWHDPDVRKATTKRARECPIQITDGRTTLARVRPTIHARPE